MKIFDIFNHFTPLSPTFLIFFRKMSEIHCMKVVLPSRLPLNVDKKVGKSGEQYYFSREIVNETSSPKDFLYSDSGKDCSISKASSLKRTITSIA